MKEQKKKRIVVILLLLSCFISGYLFFMSSVRQTADQQLNNLAQADSLIKRELSKFNIGRRQIEVNAIKVDSGFIRKTYYVDVAPAFSKTQLHAGLNRTFYKYSIETPATVSFPEKDVRIHFVYNNTVIRTLKLNTDNELVLNQKQAAILVAFDSAPDNELISELISLGEPIPIALKIENPMQANVLNKKLSNRYNRILFWLQNDEGEDLIKADPASAADKLSQLQDILPTAMMLQLSSSEKTKKLISNANLTFINAEEALILHDEMEKDAFFEALSQLKTNQSPLIIIEGSETTLNWLSEKLPELKKAGVHLISPPAMNI